MAKIYITGEDHPEQVSTEEAEEILAKKNDPQYKGLIPVNNRNIPKGRIKDIAFSSGSDFFNNKIDLSNPSDREMVRNFEKDLDAYCAKQELLVKEGLDENPECEFDFSYFGGTLENSVVERFRTNPYLVNNNIFGVVHFGIVKYAEKIGAITHPKGWDGWAIANHGIENRADVTVYVEFDRKLSALSDLKGRRAYAEKKEKEAEAELMKGKEDLAKGFKEKIPELSTEEPVF